MPCEQFDRHNTHITAMYTTTIQRLAVETVIILKLNKEPYLELVGYFPDDHDDKSIRFMLTSQSIRLSGP